MIRGLLGLATLAVLGTLATGLLRIGTDNSAERFFPRGDPVLDQYGETRRSFSLGEPVRILVQGPELWTREGIAWVRRLEGALDATDGVLYSLGPFLGLEALGAEVLADDPVALRASLDREPLFERSGILAPDGASVVVTAFLDPEQGRTRRTLTHIDSLLVAPPQGVDVAVWGLPVLEQAFDREVFRTLSVLLPLSGLGMAAIVGLCFGSFLAIIPAFLTVGMATAAVVGGLGWLGIQLDVVTSLIAPLLLVIGVPTTVHLQVQFRRNLWEGASPREAAIDAARDRGWAIAWAGLTTALAFGALALSPVRPVATLGTQAALGILGLTLLTRILLPVLLSLGRWGSGEGATWVERAAMRIGARTASWSTEHSRGVRVAFGGATVLLAVALSGLKVESDLAAYIPATHPVAEALATFEAAQVGVVAAEVVVSRPGPDDPSFLSPDELDRLSVLADRLRADSAIGSAVGGGDLFDAWSSTVGLEDPGSAAGRWLALGLLRATPRADRAFQEMVHPDLARVTALLPFEGLATGLPVLARIEGVARDAGYPTAWVTGSYPLVLRSQASLLRTLVSSLSLTLVLIGLAWFAALRGGSALRAMAPNLWAVLVVLAALVWAGIPLEAPSVMTASVVLGLAVDDTFHVFGHLRNRPAPGGLAAVFGRLAPGHLISSLALIAGFLVMLSAPMAPIADFGMLMAIGTGSALVADLVLLPALLSSRGADTPG